MTVVSLRALVGAAILAVALAACAAPTGSPSTPAATNPAAATPTAPVTTVPSPSIPPTKTLAPPATAVATNAACAAAGLRVQQVGQDGAAGHIHLVLTLTNTTATSCTLSGYPTLEMLDGGGKPMLTRISHSDVSFAPTAPHRVLLAPSASASFDVGYSHVPVGSETSCPAASAVLVRVASGGKGLRLAQRMDPCNHGAVATSAFEAGPNGTSG